MKTEVGDELPACPALGTDGAGTSPGPLLAHLQSAQGVPPRAVCFITDLRAGFGTALEAGYPPCNYSRFCLTAFKTGGENKEV